MNAPALVYPYGSALVSGLIKSTPEDFEVIEELGFEPSGEGEHLFLQVEKRGLTTPQLVERIARDYALHPRQIDYSGLKDKHAKTTQWLSLHLPGQELAQQPAEASDYRILRARRNRSKLRRGAHKFNYFRITVRAVEALPPATLAQIRALNEHGMANYFGPQRFGRSQDNVEQALARLSRGRLKRTRRGLLISSLRSYLFNQVLARRIRLGHWLEPLDGDVFMLRGSHSIFSEAPDQALRKRYAELDISSSASLYGSGSSRLAGTAQSIEQQVLDENGEITACLDRLGVKRQMRSLRVALDAFEYAYDAAETTLQLQVRLPAGSYLTSLLAHFISVSETDQPVF